MKDLQKILDRISEGSLTLDKSRDEFGKIETHSDRELMIKNNLINRLAGILVDCTILMDDLNELIENKDDETVKVTALEDLTEGSNYNLIN